MSALGIGLARCVAGSEQVLDVMYPVLRLGDDALTHAARKAIGQPSENATVFVSADQLRSLIASDASAATPIERLLRAADADRPDRALRFVVTSLADLAAPPTGVADVFFRLHLLSSRLVRPHGLSLDGIFGLLPIVAWTDRGPLTLDELEDVRLVTAASGRALEIRAVDKMPRLVDYLMPNGVRIADPSRVRLGAYLGEGTTVMHEGFVNYNAGTLGQAMVEGRISQGVTVGNGSDIGGGASIMGTLSGGGTQVVSIGEGCLLGANAGLGISLGNRCTVEAGLYVTAGSRVRLPDGRVVKALALSGQDDMRFWRNSETGAIEVHPNRKGISLNPILHD